MSAQAFDTRNIRWIAFDAVGTLIQPNPAAGAIYHRVGMRHGSRLSADEVAGRFRTIFARADQSGDRKCGCLEAGDHWHTCETRERLKWEQIVRSVLDDVAAPEACFAELFAHFGRPDAWACFPDVGASLARLRQAGFRLAVASNFDARLHPVMDGLPELAPIELRVVSSEVKYRKPSRHFFDALVRKANCAAHEILFVGDDPQVDVAAAQAAGLCAWQIDRALVSVQNRTLRSLDDLTARLNVR
ncbi:MAG TPA: HAD-IA family hydrolase [Planctomycetaceae bacterium]|nr:HAD-IA family hydrolase [Planctomycetaceae bacterium]